MRGTGIFTKLFETMQLSLATRLSIGLTVINQVNQRSFVAHRELGLRELGLEVIDEFEFEGRCHYSLGFNTARSVLDTKAQLEVVEHPNLLG